MDNKNQQTMRHNPNLKHWCNYWQSECDKKDIDKNPHNQQWYEYNCKLVDRHCPKKMPIDTTLPMLLIFSSMFIIVLRFKGKSNGRGIREDKK